MYNYKKTLVTTLIALMITAMIVPLVKADVTDVRILSPTTLAPALVLPGGSFSVHYQIDADTNKQDIRVEILLGTTVLQTTDITESGTGSPVPITEDKTVSIDVPLTVAPGTYDLKIQAKQPTGGAWDDLATVIGGVVVQTPPAADTTKPTVAVTVPTPDGSSGWFVTKPVIASITATDPSGITAIYVNGVALPSAAITGLGTTSASASYSVSSEGTTSITVTASDGATPANTGAAADSTNTATIKIDTVAPSISGSRNPAANINGWNNADVTVSFTVSDGTSGIDTVTSGGNTLTESSGTYDVTVSNEASGQSVTATATDIAGNANSNTVSGISIDKTKPEITGAATTNPNGNGWYNSDVVVHFDASDALSGLASVTPDTTVSTEGENQQVTGTAVDNADNSADFTVTGINIDKTAPTVGYDSLPITIVLNQPLTIGWTATDALSGVDGSTSGTVTGVTTSVGPHSITIPAATDKAGNTQPATIINYNVVYSTASGHSILQPLEQVNDPNDLGKTYKLGSTLPVKFQLCDYFGNPVGPCSIMPEISVLKTSNLVDIGTVNVDIDSGSSNDNGNLFRYDSVACQYIFNLSTKNLSVGTWRITVNLDDGSTIVTFFQLRK